MYDNLQRCVNFVPDELKELKQWKYSYSTDEIGRPCNVEYGYNKGFSLEESLNIVKKHPSKLMVGLYVTRDDPYVLLDIDDVKNPNIPFDGLPPKLSKLLKTKKTYAEISQSGRGLRIVYKFKDFTEKDKLHGSYYFGSEEKPPNTKPDQVHIAPPWLRFTLNKAMFSGDDIGVITIDDLAPCFKLKYSKDYTKKNVIPFSLTQPTPKKSIPSFGRIQEALNNLPLDQNPRIRRAYKKVFKCEYAHYDYWLKVMMAVNDFSQYITDPFRCLELVIAWSRQDPYSYQGDDDVQDYWEGLTTRRLPPEYHKITFRTLFMLEKNNKIRWPFVRPEKVKEGEDPGPPKPITNQYRNFITLLDFYDIKLHINELEMYTYYLSGDDDVMENWFKVYKIEKHFDQYYGLYNEKILTALFQAFLQDHEFTGIGQKKLIEFVIIFIIKSSHNRVNLFTKYIDTPYDQLPEAYRDNPDSYATSTVDSLFDTLDIVYQKKGEEREREEALYKRYIRMWLMGLVRSFYYEGDFKGNNGILILTGVEQKFKTTFFEVLLPRPFRNYLSWTIHGFSSGTDIRDLSKISSDSLILSWDEIERYFSVETESNFKAVIDGKSVKFIDKYDKSKSDTKPIAIYGGTSNKTKFKLGDSGTRRLYVLNVSQVDTDKVLKICWHPIFQELLKDLRKPQKKFQLPWKLTEEEIKFQLELHNSLRAKSNLDLDLDDIYDTGAKLQYTGSTLPQVTSFQRDSSGTLKSIKQIQVELEMHGVDMRKLTKAGLINALHRLCSRFTNTEREDRIITQPDCVISKGLATQGRRKMWCMPPLWGSYNKEEEHSFE